MTNYKVFIQRIGLIGIINLLVSLTSIILLPILTRNLQIDEYGIWVQISVTIGLLPGFMLFGLQNVLVRYIPSMKLKQDVQEILYSLFSLIFFTCIITITFLYAFSKPLASILFNGKEVIVKILLLIVIVESLNRFFLQYFRATQQIKKYSIFLIMKSSLEILLVSFFLLIGKGILGAEIGLLLCDLTILLVQITVVLSEIGINIPSFKNIKEYLSFGFPTLPGTMSQWIIDSSDRYIIGIYLGSSSVGYYSPAYAIGNIINIFLAPLDFMLPMVLSQQHDENRLDEVKNILDYSLKYFLAIAVPSVFGISILSKELLIFLTTEQIALKGYFITPFIALSSLLFGIYIIFQKILLLEKKTIITGKIAVISALLNLGFNIILIPLIGILAAAIATLISFIMSTFFMIYSSSKFLKINIDFLFILKCLFSSTVMSLIILKMDHVGILNLIIAIIIGAIFYLLSMLLLEGLKKEEILLIKKILKS